MFPFHNTNRNISWKIENKINFWKNEYWHNITIVVNDSGQEAEYKMTQTFNKNQPLDESYWKLFEIKINELFENIELKRRIDTVK